MMNFITEEFIGDYILSEILKPVQFPVRKSLLKHKEELLSFHIPNDQYIVGAGAAMALYGLRPNDDIDLCLTKKYWKIFSVKYKKYLTTAPSGSPEIAIGNISFFDNNWPLKMPIEQLIEEGVIIDGITTDSIPNLIAWKKSRGRPKDLIDIELIKSVYGRS